MSITTRARNLLKSSFAKVGVGVTSKENLERLESYVKLNEDLEFMLRLDDDKIARCLRILSQSSSQLRQDLFVLSELGFKRGGYFVEFGATNGVDLSNTLILERDFSWTGILAEPARCWHSELKTNRRCSIDLRCVWSSSGSLLTFNEAPDAKLSTVESFSRSDIHREARLGGTQYQVATISLIDLLDSYGAPQTVDYLSIDTEGSEFDILEKFDFNKYQFRIITCEHNYTGQRERIFKLLSQHGYQRKLEDLSGMDDWYVRSDAVSK